LILDLINFNHIFIPSFFHLVYIITRFYGIVKEKMQKSLVVKATTYNFFSIFLYGK